jgi:hypothetical protein
VTAGARGVQARTLAAGPPRRRPGGTRPLAQSGHTHLLALSLRCPRAPRARHRVIASPAAQRSSASSSQVLRARVEPIANAGFRCPARGGPLGCGAWARQP